MYSSNVAEYVFTETMHIKEQAVYIYTHIHNFLLKSVYRGSHCMAIVSIILARIIYKFHSTQISQKPLEQRLLNFNKHNFYKRASRTTFGVKGPASCFSRYRKYKQNFIYAHTQSVASIAAICTRVSLYFSVPTFTQIGHEVWVERAEINLQQAFASNQHLIS